MTFGLLWLFLWLTMSPYNKVFVYVFFKFPIFCWQIWRRITSHLTTCYKYGNPSSKEDRWQLFHYSELWKTAADTYLTNLDFSNVGSYISQSCAMSNVNLGLLAVFSVRFEQIWNNCFHIIFRVVGLAEVGCPSAFYCTLNTQYRVMPLMRICPQQQATSDE